MTKPFSRRDLFRTTAGATLSLGLAALADPGTAAAQAVGVAKGDLPDLTIREARVYVTDLTGYKSLNQETGELVSLVTAGGIESFYTLGNRNATAGWLDWAKANLVGRNTLELLASLASTSGMKGPYGYNGDFSGARGSLPRYSGGNTFQPAPAVGNGSAFQTPALNGSGLLQRGGGKWPNWHAAAADILLWDILGKAVNLPVYKLLPGGVGGAKDRLVAYASSTHLPNLEDYAPEAARAKKEGFLAYKIHPGTGQHRSGPAIPTYVGHIEELRQVRAAVGNEFVLAHDPVQMYNRYEAMMVGRVLDDLGYAWYEDPIRSSDKEGLAELCKALALPIHVGEFVYSIAEFAEYIRDGALDVVRLIADNVGGISGSMRLGLLADAFGLECTPHNWGNPIDLAVHFHLELALPNAAWFEVPYPPERADHPYMDLKYRPNKDGFIMAPTLPGLGVPINRGELDRLTKRLLR